MAAVSISRFGGSLDFFERAFMPCLSILSPRDVTLPPAAKAARPPEVPVPPPRGRLNEYSSLAELEAAHPDLAELARPFLAAQGQGQSIWR